MSDLGASNAQRDGVEGVGNCRSRTRPPPDPVVSGNIPCVGTPPTRGSGNYSVCPGMVRMSLGFYNEVEDVDRLIEALRRIVAGDVAGRYACDDQGEYHPTAAHPIAVRGTPRG